jgi:kynurenine formamidase
MEISATIDNRLYKLAVPGVEVSILQTFNENQPSHFEAPPATAIPLSLGEFKGSVSLGGSCNVSVLSLIPHCQGTHTETVSHLGNLKVSPHQCIGKPFFPGRLISVVANDDLAGESYQSAQLGDLFITKRQLEKASNWYSGFCQDGAILIRTLPNGENKKIAKWETSLQAPYFTSEAIKFLSALNIKHLIVDFPSLDRTYDGGRLSNHHEFFRDPSRTVTEMAFFPEHLKDGNYFVSIQVPHFLTDAVPSRIVLYPAKESI